MTHTVLGPFHYDEAVRNRIGDIFAADRPDFESLMTIEGAEAHRDDTGGRSIWARVALYNLDVIPGDAPLLKVPGTPIWDQDHYHPRDETFPPPSDHMRMIYGADEAWVHNLYRLGFYIAGVLEEIDAPTWHVSGKHVIPYLSLGDPELKSGDVYDVFAVFDAAMRTTSLYLDKDRPHGVSLYDVTSAFRKGTAPTTWNQFAADTVRRANILSTRDARKLESDLRFDRLAYPW